MIRTLSRKSSKAEKKSAKIIGNCPLARNTANKSNPTSPTSNTSDRAEGREGIRVRYLARNLWTKQNGRISTLPEQPGQMKDDHTNQKVRPALQLELCSN